MILDDQQIEIFSRQVILREVGGSGQRRLLDSRCLLLGSGPALDACATYLAGVGIGQLDLHAEPTEQAAEPAAAFAPLASRVPGIAVARLQARPADATAYHAIVVAGAATEPRSRDGSGTAGQPRLGWILLDADDGRVQLALLPRGSGVCPACMEAAAPSHASPHGAPEGAPATFLAGAMAALTVARWCSGIAVDSRARVLAWPPGAEGAMCSEDVVEPRGSCPLGCRLAT